MHHHTIQNSRAHLVVCNTVTLFLGRIQVMHVYQIGISNRIHVARLHYVLGIRTWIVFQLHWHFPDISEFSCHCIILKYAASQKSSHCFVPVINVFGTVTVCHRYRIYLYMPILFASPLLQKC